MSDSDLEHILDPVATFYGGLVEAFGAEPKAVDWPSLDRQEIRFEQFDRMLAGRTGFSLLDYGCGYGAYLAYLRRRGIDCHYRGFDIAKNMIAEAKNVNAGGDATFSSARPSGKFDFVVASGIFNVKLAAPVAEWEQHVLGTIDECNQLATCGFAFNMLSAYREPHRKMDHLFYGDPEKYLEICLLKYSVNVALLHDYDLWDFTVIVRKLPGDPERLRRFS